MGMTAAITILRARDEVQARWDAVEHPEAVGAATVTFRDAPGDRGTEVHVALAPHAGGGGRLGPIGRKLTGAAPLAVVKDDLRRFKALVETGVIARSDAVPEGETAARKLTSRPAQPLAAGEREKAEV